MSAGQEQDTGRFRYQPLGGKVHPTAAERSMTNRHDHPQAGLLGFVPGVPQQLIYRDALGRNRHISIQEAIKSARDENSLTEALYLSRFLSPSALVAEEVLRRRHERAVEEAMNAEAGRDVRRREVEWGFALGHGAGGEGKARGPSSTVRIEGVPAPWVRMADTPSLGETAGPEPVANTWPTSPNTTPEENLGEDKSHFTESNSYDAKPQQVQESQKHTIMEPEIAAREDVNTTKATNPPSDHRQTTTTSPSGPVSTTQSQLLGRLPQASLRTRGSFSSYASTISLTHVDAHSNLLDCDAMGGFFVVQQEQRQHLEQRQQDDDGDRGDESDDDQEPFGTRAGIFQPLGREQHQQMTRKHSRECKSKCRNHKGENATVVLDDGEEDDYVMVEKPREPLKGA
ncbi:hypothetical protein PspLS_06422 [Pyricularia sp. CBS 133598]|nr:hypothetical protein PspLS_06422 [Pyricularia sp. CBS 133598]